MTIYMPTILLNIIGHSTKYFKLFYFEANVSVNLTVFVKTITSQEWVNCTTFTNCQVMLVLTTMFVSVNDNLPRTSHIKMVDIWLIFTFFVPFVEVLIHTYKVIPAVIHIFNGLIQESLRVEVDRENEEENKHGESVSIAGNGCVSSRFKIQVGVKDDQRNGDNTNDQIQANTVACTVYYSESYPFYIVEQICSKLFQERDDQK